jgi:hypothetical protein
MNGIRRKISLSDTKSNGGRWAGFSGYTNPFDVEKVGL